MRIVFKVNMKRKNAMPTPHGSRETSPTRETDNTNRQGTGQGLGRDLDQHRRAMLRDIARAAYARLLRDDNRPSDSQSPSNNESSYENASGYESSDSEYGESEGLLSS